MSVVADRPRKKTILLFDDNPGDVDSYSQVLNLAGFNVVSTLIGWDLIRIHQSGGADLILLDCKSTTTSNIRELARLLKEMYPGTPVYVFSKVHEPASFADGFIRKGDPRALVATLITVFEANTG